MNNFLATLIGVALGIFIVILIRVGDLSKTLILIKVI